jgi:hypothetical protein
MSDVYILLIMNIISHPKEGLELSPKLNREGFAMSTLFLLSHNYTQPCSKEYSCIKKLNYSDESIGY